MLETPIKMNYPILINPTGQVEPIVRFQTPAQSWGTEFSPDSRFLYIGGWSLPSEKIYQYDLYNLDPSIFVLSYKFIADYEGGALQIGRDGKIYVCRDGTDWLGVINDSCCIGYSLPLPTRWCFPVRQNLPKRFTELYSNVFSSFRIHRNLCRTSI